MDILLTVSLLSFLASLLIGLGGCAPSIQAIKGGDQIYLVDTYRKPLTILKEDPNGQKTALDSQELETLDGYFVLSPSLVQEIGDSLDKCEPSTKTP